MLTSHSAVVDGIRELATVITKQDDAILRYDEEEEANRSTSPAINDCTVNSQKNILELRKIKMSAHRLQLMNIITFK